MIQLTEKNIKNGGSYGIYYKEKRKGLKTFSKAYSYNLESLPFRLKNKEFILVFIECIYFNLFYGSNKAKIVICEDKKENNPFFLGFLMPHFKGINKDLKKYYINSNKKITSKKTKTPLMLDVVRKYHSKKMYNHDMNYGNILIYKNEYKIIDFTPEFIQYYGTKTSFISEMNKVLKEFKKDYLKQVLSRSSFPEQQLKN